jgi:hypothetical protein
VSSPLFGAVSIRRAFCISAGIVPSITTAYQLGDLQSAFKARTGGIPYVGCGNNGTVLQEVWYFNHACGPVSGSTRSCQIPGANSAKVQSGRFKILNSGDQKFVLVDRWDLLLRTYIHTRA